MPLASLWPGLHQQKNQEFELQMFVCTTNFFQWALNKFIFKLWKFKKFKFRAGREYGLWTGVGSFSLTENQWVTVGYMYTPLITVIFRNQRIRSKNLPWARWFFHENHQFVENFEIHGTGSLVDSENIKRTRTRSCKIVENIKRTRTRFSEP